VDDLLRFGRNSARNCPITRLPAKDNIPPFSGRLPTQKNPVDLAKEIRVPVPERMKKRRSSGERVAESGLSTRPARKVRYFLAVSQTSASASSENNRQPEQDDCDRHKRRAGDVSDQDEDDRDDGEDCCDVVVHSFSIVGLPTLRCEPTPCRLCGGAQVA
jgi:hypothetical protein